MVEQEQTTSFYNKNKKFIWIMGATFFLGCIYLFIGGDNKGNGSAQIVTNNKNTGNPVDSTDPEYASQVQEYNNLRANAASEAGKSHFDTLTAKTTEPAEDPFAKNLAASMPSGVNNFAPQLPVANANMTPQPVVYQHTIIKEVAVTPDTKYNWRNDPTLITFFDNQNPNNLAQQNGSQQGMQGFKYNQGLVTQQQTQQQAQQAANSQPVTQNGTNQEVATNITVKRNGDMAPATLLTPIDTTRPSIVRARIESGELAGAIVSGAFERAETSVSINFNSITIPGIQQSLPIQAVAMDLKTASTALSTSVNRHIPERLLMTFVSSFAESYSEVLSDNNTSSASRTVIDSATGNTTQVSTSDTTKKTAGEINREAGAKAISEATRLANDMVPKQPTVKVRMNHEIAVYFTGDFSIPKAALVGAKNARLSNLK